MIELHQFRPAYGLLNASPFCMKVEVFLQLAGLPYTSVLTTPPYRSPKGKFPALKDGGTWISDSEAIVAYLQRQYHDRLPAALREPELGVDLALRRLLEEDLYFTELWGRWMPEAAFAITAPAFFGKLPWPLRSWVPRLVRAKMRRDLKGQGMGRHAPAEIAARACADHSALAAALGERPFFGGVAPSALDCSAYAFVANGLHAPFDGPVRRHLRALPSLVAYDARMAQRLSDLKAPHGELARAA